jgi:hypothetical protein
MFTYSRNVLFLELFGEIDMVESSEFFFSFRGFLFFETHVAFTGWRSWGNAV